jgi:hypothetical protein
MMQPCKNVPLWKHSSHCLIPSSCWTSIMTPRLTPFYLDSCANIRLTLTMFVHCRIVRVFLINGQLHVFKCDKFTPLTKQLPLLFVAEIFFKLAQSTCITNFFLCLCCWNLEKWVQTTPKPSTSFGKGEQFFP